MTDGNARARSRKNDRREERVDTASRQRSEEGQRRTERADDHDRGRLAYEPGPDRAALGVRYGIEVREREARQLQRLEAEFGSDRVGRWADEGIPVETMGKPRDMQAFRNRQTEQTEEVLTNVERRNEVSERRKTARTRDDGRAGEADVPDIVGSVVSSPSRALDKPIQREMEEKMGEDFADVRVHTGPRAAAAGEAIDARAFTVGNHVAFNRGEYDPGSGEGKKVMAHELTHVRQQTDGRISMLPKASANHPGTTAARETTGGTNWYKGTEMHLQPKLEVSSPDDPAEKEAERVAEQVMKMDGPLAPSSKEHSEDGNTSRDREDSGLEPTVTVDRSGEGAVTGALEGTVRRGVMGGGKPLPEETRANFESKMGIDLSEVRVHTGSTADEAAKSINAEAYTMGTDIAFAKGTYNPDSKDGKELLAHELTHVAQHQGRNPSTSQLSHVARQQGTESSMPIPPEVADEVLEDAGLKPPPELKKPSQVELLKIGKKRLDMEFDSSVTREWAAEYIFGEEPKELPDIFRLEPMDPRTPHKWSLYIWGPTKAEFESHLVSHGLSEGVTSTVAPLKSKYGHSTPVPLDVWVATRDTWKNMVEEALDKVKMTKGLHMRYFQVKGESAGSWVAHETAETFAGRWDPPPIGIWANAIGSLKAALEELDREHPLEFSARDPLDLQLTQQLFEHGVEQYEEASSKVLEFLDDTLETGAARVVTTLETTKDVSFTIVETYTAVTVGAPTAAALRGGLEVTAKTGQELTEYAVGIDQDVDWEEIARVGFDAFVEFILNKLGGKLSKKIAKWIKGSGYKNVKDQFGEVVADKLFGSMKRRIADVIGDLLGKVTKATLKPIAMHVWETCMNREMTGDTLLEKIKDSILNAKFFANLLKDWAQPGPSGPLQSI